MTPLSDPQSDMRLLASLRGLGQGEKKKRRQGNNEKHNTGRYQEHYEVVARTRQMIGELAWKRRPLDSLSAETRSEGYLERLPPFLIVAA
jgi:hypothetical protein